MEIPIHARMVFILNRGPGIQSAAIRVPEISEFESWPMTKEEDNMSYF